MKILLVAVNAKYIHSNLGIYSLKAYAGQQLDSLRPRQATIELAEYTINHQMDACLQDIYRRRPDVIGFSCYIWNIGAIRREDAVLSGAQEQLIRLLRNRYL